MPTSKKFKEKWAVKLFENWSQQRNAKVRNTGGISDVNILHNSLEVMCHEELNHSLASFGCEVWKLKPLEVNIHSTNFMVNCLNSTLFKRKQKHCSTVQRRYINFPFWDNILASVVKRLCEEGGISRYRTKHSLRTTVLLQHKRMTSNLMGIDEQLMCKKAGERIEIIYRWL